MGVVRREQMHSGKLEDMKQEITCFTNRLLCETTNFLGSWKDYSKHLVILFMLACHGVNYIDSDIANC